MSAGALDIDISDAGAPTPAEAVRATLREYAGRSIIRGLSEEETQGGHEFRFRYVGPRSHHLVFDPDEESLTWDGILPGAGAGTVVAEDIGDFLQSRADDDLPPHRRLDPERASIALHDRDEEGEEPGEGSGSLLVLRIHDGDHEHAVRKLMNLVNEVWIRLNDAHQRYMWEKFDAPME